MTRRPSFLRGMAVAVLALSPVMAQSASSAPAEQGAVVVPPVNDPKAVRPAPDQVDPGMAVSPDNKTARQPVRRPPKMRNKPSRAPGLPAQKPRP